MYHYMPCQHNNIDCPFPKDYPRHGHCCACVAHHKAHRTKLPACLRGIDWQKNTKNLRKDTYN